MTGHWLGIGAHKLGPSNQAVSPPPGRGAVATLSLSLETGSVLWEGYIPSHSPLAGMWVSTIGYSDVIKISGICSLRRAWDTPSSGSFPTACNQRLEPCLKSGAAYGSKGPLWTWALSTEAGRAPCNPMSNHSPRILSGCQISEPWG